MSLVSEVSKNKFVYRNYGQSGNIFEKFLRSSDLSVYSNDGNALSKCCEVVEVSNVYGHCCGGVFSEKLTHVAFGLMESVMEAYSHPPKANVGVFVCGICENVLRQPTTTSCGHTFCRRCLAKDGWRTCRKCGQKVNSLLETNVLIKRLVEKFWSGEVVAAEIREEGNDLFQKSELEQAVTKYNEALSIAPNDHLALCARSHALWRMGRYQAALLDAEHVVRIRPHWAKGHQRKGIALLAMGWFEEALISLCISVALDRNPQAVCLDICKILHNLLTRHKGTLTHFGTPSQARFRRAKYFQCSPALSSSDCDDQSSGDEDCYELYNSLSTLRSNFYFMVNRIFAELEKLKRMDTKVTDLCLEPSLLDKSDFDCVLCCRTLWKPITTPCGHTYCLTCLDRSLDYSSACPLCMKNLSEYLSVSPKNVTEFLSKILKTHLPGEYLTRQITHQAEISQLIASCYEKEPHVPVFVCTTAYPSIHCPLFIYEPRYRLMIRQCIEAGTRQFGIAACFTSESGSRRFADFGTMLEIRDWVLMANGCSILSTVGIRRFRTLSRGERDGYETAKVKFLIDEPVSDSCLPTLNHLHDKVRQKALSWVETFSLEFKQQVVTSFGTMPEVEEDWSSLPDGPSWMWWLLAILPLGPLLQVSILGTTSLEKRLRAIDKTLNQIQNTLQPQHYLKYSVREPGTIRNHHS